MMALQKSTRTLAAPAAAYRQSRAFTHRAFALTQRGKRDDDVVTDPQDPFPLHDARHRGVAMTPDMTPIDPLPRPNESVEVMRARMLYQSRKRGILETDLLLSTFAQDFLPACTEQDLRDYDKLLDQADWDIYYWAVGKREPPAEWRDSKVLKAIQDHVRAERKGVLRMPDL